ncbi:rod shape-determining protein MreB [Ignavigranum ruoffiae]|uniref:rod shape-determining protein n=1 Tax=Ignavigranum ruoffiae TaxID=89093 RepID=UPI002355E945|nr:rod shape-determining protein [Ignavigranum ruoffiae]
MTKAIGIDLGTTNVLIHLKGRGVILNEPSLVAIDKESQSILAYGKMAYAMLGRTGSNVEVIRPLKAGVIADFDLTEAMLLHYLEQIHGRRWFNKPNVLICTPAEISELEQASLIEAIERVAGGNIYLEEEAKVAAVGSGINILSAKGAMVIDIGGGTTDIAVISAGNIIASRSLKIAGNQFDAAIIQYFKEHRHLLIGEASAEAVKIAIATAEPLSAKLNQHYDLRGRDLLTGLPRSINVDANEICQALQPSLDFIARNCREVLEEVSPEIAGDIIENGVTLTGGSALIYNMDSFLSQTLKTSVIKADQPMQSVVLGTGLMLEMIQAGRFDQSESSWQDKLKRRLRRWRRRIFG